MIRTAALIFALTLFTGCQTFGAFAPQSSAAITARNHRTEMADARRAYSAAERQIIHLHQNGTIPADVGRALVGELRATVRPLLDDAQAQEDGLGFDAAILKANAAIASVQARANATTKPTTRPTLFRIPPSEPPVHQPEPIRATAAALGLAALEILKFYNQRKAEEEAKGIADKAATDALDKQIIGLVLDNDAADREADIEFGTVPPKGEA